jgi:ABC-2 type transport system ATP-binding protein
MVNIHDTEIDRFLSVLKGYRVKFITEIKYSLEKYFKSQY